MKASLPALALALVLAGCATSSGYGPATSGSSSGYTEQKIEETRYRVSYRANNPDFAENGALRRAAELTLAEGYDWFTVVTRDLERTRSGGGSSVGLGGGNIGRRGGVGVGVSVPLSQPRERVNARVEILMGSGERPEGPRSYDARSLVTNLAGS
jgi:hypothetical protein